MVKGNADRRRELTRMRCEEQQREAERRSAGPEFATPAGKRRCQCPNSRMQLPCVSLDNTLDAVNLDVQPAYLNAPAILSKANGRLDFHQHVPLHALNPACTEPCMHRTLHELNPCNCMRAFVGPAFQRPVRGC